MAKKDGADDPVKEAQQSAVARLSERLSDPLLFTLIIVVALHHWELFYVLIASRKDVEATIRLARTYTSNEQLIFDVVLALVYFLVWPHINRTAVRYLAEQAVKTENARLAAKHGEHNLVSDVWSLPAVAAEREANRRVQLTLIAHFQAEHQINGGAGLGIAPARKVEAPCCAVAVPQATGLFHLFPIGEASYRPSAEIVYALDIPPALFQADAVHFFVKSGTNVPWPASLPNESHRWQNNAWVQVHAGSPNPPGTIVLLFQAGRGMFQVMPPA